MPEWIPADAWAGYLEMRKEIRKPMTRNAYVLAVNRLRILHRDGQDPRAVLEQSTLNSWQGLFALRVETKGKGGGAWWLDDVSRMAKAAEVGVRSNPGESVASFEGRIRAAIDNGGTPPVPKPAPVVRISDHQDSGNVSRTPDAARARTLALAAALKKGQA